MIEIPNRSKFFGLVIGKVVAYKETEKKDDSEHCDVRNDEDLFTDPAVKTRKLRGVNVPSVVFTVGERPPCWLPKEQFDRVTGEIDPSKRTSTPHSSHGTTAR